MLTSILIGLIVITLIVVIAMNYMPYVLPKELNIFRNKKIDRGPLAQIFYKYDHEDSIDWLNWIKQQDQETKDEAIEKIKNHIELSPASWGSITREAIKAYAGFGKREHTTLLKSVLSTCRKTWGKYMMVSACYEEACKGIIRINEDSAKKIINSELDEQIKVNSEKTACIINALSSFKKAETATELYVRIVADITEGYHVRNQALISISKKDEDTAHQIFCSAVEEFVHGISGPFSSDDYKIFDSLLNFITNKTDERCLNLLIESCNSLALSITAINSISHILNNKHQNFSKQQLQALISLENDHNDVIGTTMAAIQELSSAEKLVIHHQDYLAEYPFERSAVNHESKTELIETPIELKDLYEKVIDSLKERSMMKQNDEPGGVLLSGRADLEKLLICRAIATEKKWTFVYANYNDLIDNEDNISALDDLVQMHKPCLVYLNEVGAIIENHQNAFENKLKEYSRDAMVFLVGSFQEDANIDEKGCCEYFYKDELFYCFPYTIEVSALSEASKNKVVQFCLGQLQPNREQSNSEQYEILEPSARMLPFEFKDYLVQYFRASLLLHGRLIRSSDFERLNEMEFIGKRILVT